MRLIPVSSVLSHFQDVKIMDAVLVRSTYPYFPATDFYHQTSDDCVTVKESILMDYLARSNYVWACGLLRVLAWLCSDHLSAIAIAIRQTHIECLSLRYLPSQCNNVAKYWWYLHTLFSNRTINYNAHWCLLVPGYELSATNLSHLGHITPPPPRIRHADAAQWKRSLGPPVCSPLSLYPHPSLLPR